MDESSIQKIILIIKANPKNLTAPEQFLRNRDWKVLSTTDMKQALTFMVQNKPTFVMVAADHPNKKIRNLPKLLIQAFPVCILAFAENATSASYRMLQDAFGEYKINPPVTGPSIERAVQKYMRDLERKTLPNPVQQAKDGSVMEFKGPAVIKGGNGAMTFKGESSQQDGEDSLSLDSLNQLLAQVSGKNEGPTAAGVISGDANRAGGNSSITGTLGGDTNSSVNGNLGKDSNSSVAGSFGTGPDSSVSGSLSRSSNSSLEGTFGKDSESSVAGTFGRSSDSSVDGSFGRDADSSVAGSLGKDRNSGVAGSLGRDPNSGADGDYTDDSESGAGVAGSFGKSKKGRVIGEVGESTDNTVAGQFEKSKRRNDQAGDFESTKDNTTAGDFEDSSSEGDQIHGGFGKKSGRRGSQKYDRNQGLSDSDHSIIVRGTQEALEKTVEIGNGQAQKKITKNTSVACIVVESTRFSGYLIAAMAENRQIDVQFIRNVQIKLLKFLKDNGEQVTDKENIQLKIKEVEFEDWAMQYANFLRKSVHQGNEVAMAFFPMRPLTTEVGESAASHMASFDMDELAPDQPVDFNVYIYLPANNRYVLYTPKGSVFYGAQKDRLKSQGVDQVHMLKAEVQGLATYKAQQHLNHLIDDYQEEKKNPKKLKATGS